MISAWKTVMTVLYKNHCQKLLRQVANQPGLTLCLFVTSRIYITASCFKIASENRYRLVYH